MIGIIGIIGSVGTLCNYVYLDTWQPNVLHYNNNINSNNYNNSSYKY